MSLRDERASKSYYILALGASSNESDIETNRTLSFFPFAVRPSKAREYEITLYHDPNHDPDPYGFGLRVVGTTTGERQIQCARVLWICPGGPAERGGVRVGDRVSCYS